MSDKTPNHELNLYTEGDENWTHTPDMETIEERLVVRDLEENRDEYTPYADALFFARDSKTWYIGEGTSWTLLGNMSDSATAEGITNVRDYIGPLHQGNYHNPGTSLWGIHFWAEGGLTIQSTVLDYNSANSTDDTVTLELWNAVEDDTDGKSDSVAVEDSPVDSVTTSALDDGPQRVDLDFTVPSDGEYFVGATGDVELRRISDWDGWDDYDRSDIDLRFGTRFDNPTSSDYSGYYYYMFDLEIGPGTRRVTSPWSHDVEEIYMRPRDPTEEFDDVSPRALWFDTS